MRLPPWSRAFRRNQVLAAFVNEPRLIVLRLHPQGMWSLTMTKAQIFMLAIALMLCFQSVAMAKSI